MGFEPSRGAQIDIPQAIFLGIVQGITEFLPISSSGHLVFFQSLLGFREPQLLFDVMLHFGTLLAVVIIFRNDLWRIILGTSAALRGTGEDRDGARLLLWIILATLPTGLMGFFLKDWFESFFSRPAIVGVMLLLTGLILWSTRWTKDGKKDIRDMGFIDAIMIGIAQGVAIIPGISRSGATTSAGLFCGLNRELSGRFAFLVSIPAILGASVLELKDVHFKTNLGPVLLGTLAAFGVGLLALTAFLRIIRKGKLYMFSYYCWGVGALILILGK